MGMWLPVTRAQRWVVGLICLLLLLATIGALMFSQSVLSRSESASRAMSSRTGPKSERSSGRGRFAKPVPVRHKTYATSTLTTFTGSSDHRMIELRDKFARSEQYDDREAI